MSVKCDLDEGETQNSVLVVCETWHVWRWDTNVVTQAEVELYMDEGEIGIFGPGWKWAGTWMEMRQEFWDLEAGEAGHGCRWSTHPETRISLIWAWIELICIFLGLDGGEKVHWRSWCKNLETWMQMRQGLDMRRHTSWNPDGFEIGHGWNWDAILGTWMELRHHLGGGESQISGHGLRWDTTWIKMRLESSYLDIDE